MNCSRSQRLVALSISGDLSLDQARKLDAHVESCAACRELAVQLREDLENLRALDAAAAGAGDLGSVRGSVMERIDGRKRTVWFLARPGAVAAAAAVVVVCALAVLLRWDGGAGDVRVVHSEPVDVPPALEIDRPAAELPPPTVEDVSEVRIRYEAAGDPVVDASPAVVAKSTGSTDPPRMAAAEAMTMKIFTDDPEVVIYWVVEAKGETDA